MDTVSVTSDTPGPDTLHALYAWVRQDPAVRETRTRLSLDRAPARPGTLGSTFESINAVLASATGLTTVVLSVLAWRDTRPRPPRIRFERDGVTVTVYDDSPDNLTRILAALGEPHMPPPPDDDDPTCDS
ncbi:hypothetical protein STRCI_008185 [Streptomyces cinnabarinus]|uniref:Uncharacterized protein n=1 Tax=Streptomyces cinnabarinus TaxID=67287 RepID=A0ABY7KV30_9ACTN|nr:hypothetical protein [Streptomyces cinnabarinus]WAZ26591.1 hypothetical protein STRCI_008185 [Streptomyces cinnabarinus]